MMDMIEKIDLHIAQMQTLREVAEKLHGIDGEINPLHSPPCIDIEVPSLDEVHAMRKQLRERLGQWSDTLKQIFSSLGRGIAIFESHKHPVRIQLVTRIADFPKDLMGETCHFEETTRTEMNYVCSPR